MMREGLARTAIIARAYWTAWPARAHAAPARHALQLQAARHRRLHAPLPAMADAEQAALQAAAQAVLHRNAHLVLALDGACPPLRSLLPPTRFGFWRR